MPLTAGSRLGPYEILSPLGAGGMGEVYRARDARLERTVAVKVLPSHMSASPDVRQRFEREAKTISQLSHPHICALYDVGSHEGTEYLVMELLEGETLADRLAKGPLPLEQTLRYGTEIADALDKAHRQGIVHRDLKPGNVMITKSGVKLLDFGLAKAMAPAAPQASLSALPTAAKGLTQEGTILGTFQYMAPEQLEGKEADGRTDIFAFGAVLYEMATGRTAFTGASRASLISAIMQNDPPSISIVQPTSPPALDRVVKTCLAKDPDDRWQSAGDLKRELRWIAEGGSQAGLPAPVVARRKNRERLAWAGAAIAILAAGLAVFGYLRRSPKPAQLMRFELATPEEIVEFDVPSVSPDGRYVAFNAKDSSGKTRIWLRPLDALAAQPLSGTEGTTRPFWSPDSRFLGFFAEGKLKKIEVSGEPPQEICDVPTGGDGTWSREGVILFDDGVGPIQRVSAAGGVPSVAVKADPTRKETYCGWPEFLPDGRHFLYIAYGAKAEVRVGSLDSKDSKVLTSAQGMVKYAPPGYLLFVRNRTLVTQPFDAKSLKTTGEPVPLAEKIGVDWVGQADFSVSREGTLAYRTGEKRLELIWFDRAGKQIGRLGSHKAYGDASLSPDGRRVAASLRDTDGTSDIWLLDALRDVASRFTFRRQTGMWNPIWSPDGSRIVFASPNADGISQLFVKPSDGGGADEPLLVTGKFDMPTDWSPDGRFVAFEERDAKTGKRDLWLLPMSGDRKPVPYLQTPFEKFQGQFSPDGQWMAYGSDETGRWEIYLQPIPATGGKWLVSNAGGTQPRWRRDGGELFYLSLDGRIMSVDVKLGRLPELSAPKALFPVRIMQNAFGTDDFVVTPDGQRILASAAASTTAGQSLTIVLNWQKDLK